jgi:hypothetical protein
VNRVVSLWQTSCSLFSSPSLQVSGHAQFLTSLSGSSDDDSMAILVFWDACFKEHLYSNLLSYQTETTDTSAETM